MSTLRLDVISGENRQPHFNTFHCYRSFLSSSTSGWLSRVFPEGTFECPEGLEIKYGEEDFIPEGWTVKTR